jgi:hypothetical protein
MLESFSITCSYYVVMPNAVGGIGSTMITHNLRSPLVLADTLPSANMKNICETMIGTLNDVCASKGKQRSTNLPVGWIQTSWTL